MNTMMTPSFSHTPTRMKINALATIALRSSKSLLLAVFLIGSAVNAGRAFIFGVTVTPDDNARARLPNVRHNNTSGLDEADVLVEYGRIFTKAELHITVIVPGKDPRSKQPALNHQKTKIFPLRLGAERNHFILGSDPQDGIVTLTSENDETMSKIVDLWETLPVRINSQVKLAEKPTPVKDKSILTKDQYIAFSRSNKMKFSDFI